MAIQKNIELDSGVSSLYHKILRFDYDGISKMTNILVASYKDQDSRDNNKCAIEISSYQTALDVPSVSSAYTYLKSLNKFSSSQDC